MSAAAVEERETDPCIRRVVLPRPLAHQVPILESPARFKVVCCGRRFGKTMLGLLAVLVGHGPGRCFKGALQGGNVWWIAPTDKVARKIWRDLKRALRRWGGELAKNEVERRIEFPGGGSIEVRSAHDPEALRGDGLDGVVIDEAAFTHPETWDTLRPAIADLQGWAIFISTPNGVAHWFFKEYEAAVGDPDYERWQRPTSANPKLAPREIERMRRRMGAAKFARECEARFDAEGLQKFKREWFRYYERIPGGFRLGSLEVAHSQLTRFATVDTAGSVSTRADHTALGSWAQAPGGHLLLLDMTRRKISGAEKLALMKAAVKAHALTEVWIETNAYASDLISIARGMDGLGKFVRELVADKDKLRRAEPAMAELEAGHVWFPRGLEEFEDELVAFDGSPKGEDDQVDVLSYAVRVMRSRKLSGAPLPRSTRAPREYPGLDAERPS